MLTARGIGYFPGYKPVAVASSSRTIRFESGDVAKYDLLAHRKLLRHTRPHCAPQVSGPAVALGEGAVRTDLVSAVALGCRQ
jgi:hypothetical protein